MRKKFLSLVCGVLLLIVPFAGCSEKSDGNIEALLDIKIDAVCILSNAASSMKYHYYEQEEIDAFVAVVNQGGEYKTTEEEFSFSDFVVAFGNENDGVCFFVSREGYIRFEREEQWYKTITPMAGMQEQIKEVIGDDWTY